MSIRKRYFSLIEKLLLEGETRAAVEMICAVVRPRPKTAAKLFLKHSK